jgi:pimeloyl-ACP methyl ester carboxylesterase
MLGVKHWGLPKFHVVGHHSGSSIATELAATYGEQVLSLTAIGPALLTKEEQHAYLSQEVVPYNKPVMDGSHWQKVWNLLLTNGTWEVKDLHEQTLDAVRAWAGRIQIYTCVFTQNALEVFGAVKVPVLALCAPDDSLYSKLPRVKEIVSILNLSSCKYPLTKSSYLMLLSSMLRAQTLSRYETLQELRRQCWISTKHCNY